MDVARLLKQRRQSLAELDEAPPNWSAITEWHAGTRPVLLRVFPEQAKYFDEFLKVKWTRSPRISIIGGGPSKQAIAASASDRRRNDAKMKNTTSKLLNYLDGLLELVDVESETANDVEQHSGSDRVFLVHGHNEHILHETARFLEGLGLDVVILREQPNAGRTIIEKFVDYSNVAFAIVLLTGDDRGGTSASARKDQSLRARQNVILELGFFLGKLGRHRVGALYEEGVEIPSDYSGVLFTRLDSGGAWKLALAKELKEAGLPVDWNAIV